jgi:hypothetical protein
MRYRLGLFGGRNFAAVEIFYGALIVTTFILWHAKQRGLTARLWVIAGAV